MACGSKQAVFMSSFCEIARATFYFYVCTTAPKTLSWVIVFKTGNNGLQATSHCADCLHLSLRTVWIRKWATPWNKATGILFSVCNTGEQETSL